MTAEFVKENIKEEMMGQLKKEYPHLTEEQIIENLTDVFNKVGVVVIKLVTDIWDIMKETTKDLTVEELKSFFDSKKKIQEPSNDQIEYVKSIEYISTKLWSMEQAKEFERRIKSIMNVNVAFNEKGNREGYIHVYSKKPISYGTFENLGIFFYKNKIT